MDVRKRSTRSFGVKLGAALLLLGMALGFAAYRYYHSATGAMRAAEEDLAQLGGPPTPAERRAIRNEVLGKLNLTAEQRQKIDAINARFDREEEELDKPPLKRMLAIAGELSPDQIAIGRTEVRRQIDGIIAKRIQVLPREEQQKFLVKMEARRQGWREEFERDYARDVLAQENENQR